MLLMNNVISWPIQTIEENGTEVKDNEGKSYTSEIESFRSLAGDSDAERLEAFINQICSGGEDSISPIVLSPDSDKSHRTVSFDFHVIFLHLLFHVIYLGHKYIGLRV